MQGLELAKRYYEEVGRPMLEREFPELLPRLAAGLVGEYRIMCESALSVFRAGANMLITYYAKELAQAIQKGDIG